MTVAYNEDVKFEAHAEHDESVLILRMVGIKESHGVLIKKHGLRLFKRNAVFSDVIPALGGIPFEMQIAHMYIVHRITGRVNALFGAAASVHDVTARVGIDEPAYHLLVGGVVLFRGLLEELHARFAQRHRYFDAFVFESEFLRRRQEILDQPDLPKRLIRVLYFLFYKWPSPLWPKSSAMMRWESRNAYCAALKDTWCFD